MVSLVGYLVAKYLLDQVLDSNDAHKLAAARDIIAKLQNPYVLDDFIFLLTQ